MYTLLELFDKCDRTIKYETTPKNEVNYQFEVDGKTLYIFFEPSNGKLDWRHNFQFSKRPYKDMKVPYRVHRGFLKCWKEIEDIIISKVKEIDDSDPSKLTYKYDKIIIVGYSHGAAIAMLCHECCWFHREDIRDSIKTIAFDGPRVYGGFKVKKKLQERWKNFILIRNDTDIVTHVPPYIFGYTHVGTVVQIGYRKKYGPFKSHYQDKIKESLSEYSANKIWETILFN